MRKRSEFSVTTLALLAVLVSGAAAAEPRATFDLDDATGQRCLDVLREGLRSDEFWPSIHAAEGLTLGGHGREVRALLKPKLATEKDDQRRCGISRELVRAGDKAQAKVMLEILAGEDPYGHVHAAESLYKVGHGDRRTLRRAKQQTHDVRLQMMAAAALGRAGDEAAIAFVRDKMGHPDPQVYHLSAWILGRIGDRRDIEPLRKRLAGAPDELTRAYLEHALAALGDAEGLKALQRNLSSTNPQVRTYAATFAGDARALSTVPRLKQMLDDPHLDARLRAAQSLLVLSRQP